MKSGQIATAPAAAAHASTTNPASTSCPGTGARADLLGLGATRGGECAVCGWWFAARGAEAPVPTHVDGHAEGSALPPAERRAVEPAARAKPAPVAGAHETPSAREVEPTVERVAPAAPAPEVDVQVEPEEVVVELVAPSAPLAQVQPPNVAALTLTHALPRDQNPAAVYLASLGSNKSRAGQRSALEGLARELGGNLDTVHWSAIRYPHATALRAGLAQRFAPATVNKTLSALRGVLREAMRLGQMSAEDCARACDVKNVKGSREPTGRALSGDELRALFAVCNGTTVAGARDAALLAILYGAGLRRSEVVALDLASLDVATGAVRVLGKGNKQRIVYATNGSRTALDAWITLRGAEPGALFVRVSKTDRPLYGARLSDAAVAFLLGRLATRASVADFGPHDLRRSCISDLLDAGADIATVQRLAGHAQVTTTQRYDRRGERTKLRAAELLRIPYGEPRPTG